MRIAIQERRDAEVEVRACKKLVVAIARRPGATKLLIGVCYWLISVVGAQATALEMLARIKPVLRMYADYKRR